MVDNNSTEVIKRLDHAERRLDGVEVAVGDLAHRLGRIERTLDDLVQVITDLGSMIGEKFATLEAEVNRLSRLR